jgi:hypothetical protein
MGLDDLFEGRGHDRHSHGRYERGYGDREYSGEGYGGGHRDKSEMIRLIAGQVLRNKPLLAGLAVAAVLLVVIGIAIIAAAFPLLLKLIGYVEQNGLKGIIDFLMPFLKKSWEGNG